MDASDIKKYKESRGEGNNNSNQVNLHNTHGQIEMTKENLPCFVTVFVYPKQ